MHVQSSQSRLWRLACSIFRRTNVPAIVAFAVVTAAGIYAHRLNQTVYEQDLRATVLREASVLRAKLEGNVNGNIQLIRGLVATITTEPEMGQARFVELASALINEQSQIRNIAAAPDFVVRAFYPVKGNEQVMGFDLRNNPQQREAAFRARDTRHLVFAGPVNLVQGGQGFIGRFPVYIKQDGADRFWGIVSAVIDVERLYGESGLLDTELPVDVAIVGRDALGTAGELFYGDAEILKRNPVTTDVIVPSGTWRIAAIPKGGWPAWPPNTLMLWLIVSAAGALIIVPILLSGQLIEERTRNVAELKRRERDLSRLSRRLELALDSSSIGVWELNVETNELFWDDRMNELYGYPADDGRRTYEDWARHIHPDDIARVTAAQPDPDAQDGDVEIEYRLVVNGEVRHIRESARAYRDPGEPTKIVGVNWDVTDDVKLREHLTQANTLTEARNSELEAAKARIEFNALHDSLTGLPNRRYLDDVLDRHPRYFDHAGERVGLLHIDLDRFKQINDTLGHAAGDAMLVHAAAVLKANLRSDDFVARVGGDEFVVIRAASADTATENWNTELAALADGIIAQMHQPVFFKGHECRFGVSIGIATNMEVDGSPRDLLVHADIALYRAKSRGRNRHQFFNDALQAEIITTKRVADEILSGLERQEFVAYYQPQFDAITHEVIGAEALARWRHPTRGVLAPQAFIKTAEELNVLAAIDRIILEQALAQMQQWDGLSLKVPKVSVNVSARRLHDDELIRNLRRLNIAPGRVAFELVESIFLDEHDELVTWNVEQIKALGIDVEIDDFGTGHASIVSLLKLQPNRLKIDRQLVMPVVHSAPQRKLVHSIIEIGRSLGIDVLGEGVETMQHARVLAELGCNALQGHAFARPMSADYFTAFMKARIPAKAS